MNNFQLNILLLALGLLQGFFLFVLFYKKRRALPGYPFLAAYLAVMILQIMMKLASKLWLMATMKPLYFLSYYLPFLYGPLIWLFVRQFAGKHPANKKAVIHFLPFIIAIPCCIPQIQSTSIDLFLWSFMNIKSSMFLQLISLSVYHYISFYDLKNHNGNFFPNPAILYKSRIIWLRQFIILSFFVCSVIAVVICLMYYHYPDWQYVRFGFVTLTVFIYWVSYKVWSQPELFSVILGGADQVKQINPAPGIHSVKKYSNSGLEKEDLQKIILSLENKLQVDKSYLNPELTIDDLAVSLSCSRHHLSQAINEILGKSFYDCINHYRVEEAKLLLSDPGKNSFKIASLAFDAGFNSISTFNDVFKKSTGLTPSQFRKQREENNLRKQRV